MICIFETIWFFDLNFDIWMILWSHAHDLVVLISENFWSFGFDPANFLILIFWIKYFYDLLVLISKNFWSYLFGFDPFDLTTVRYFFIKLKTIFIFWWTVFWSDHFLIYFFDARYLPVSLRGQVLAHYGEADRPSFG